MAISTQFIELTTFAVAVYADFQPQHEQRGTLDNKINKLVNFQRRSGDRHLFAIIHEAVRATMLCCEFRRGLRSSPPIDCRNWNIVDTSTPNDTQTMTATIQEALSLQQKYWQPRLRLNGLQALASLARSPEYRDLLLRFTPQLRDAITESLLNCGEDLQVMASFLSYTLQNNGIYLSLNTNGLATQMEQADTCHFAHHNAFCQLGLRLALQYLLFTPSEQKSPAEIPEEDFDIADVVSSEDDEEVLEDDEEMEPFSGLEHNEEIGEPDESTDEDADKPVETLEEEERRCRDRPNKEDLRFNVPVDEPDGDEEYRPEEDQDDAFDSDDSASSEDENF